MEFHVWNLSSRMEVQLSKEMINYIHNMKIRKRILVEEKQPHLCPGWKKPHKRKFYMSREVKIIAHSWGHTEGLHKIAERLYAERDWHGRGRPVVPHKPYIRIDELRTVQQVTKIPRDKLEASIVSVRNDSSKLEVNMKFPVKTNEDWAWLFGYYFASGSLITRDRIGEDGYRIEERAVRMRVERRVYEKKLVPILQRIGYVPKITAIWYEKYGGHKLDKHRRKGTGNRPRKLLMLPRVIREVMEHFGLYTDYVRQAPIGVQSAGRLLDQRKIKMSIPSWITTRPLKHAFVEGFMNGGQTSSQFRAENRGLMRMVELRFGTIHQQETEKLINFFGKELKAYGIRGSTHRIKHREKEKVYWLGYEIYARESLGRLFESFDIQQPVVRSRLMLAYFMNSLLYELCKRTPLFETSDTLILGGLMENPQSEEDLADTFRLRTDQVTMSLNRLKAWTVVEKQNGTWRIIPTGCRERLSAALRLEDETRQNILTGNRDQFFSRCNKCGNTIAHNYTGKCGCGGMFEPIERKRVLKPFAHSNRTRIARILAEELPDLSEIK